MTGGFLVKIKANYLNFLESLNYKDNSCIDKKCAQKSLKCVHENTKCKKSRIVNNCDCIKVVILDE